MTPLHQWLGLYLDRTEARDWRDGHLYTEALNQMASHWFSRIKLRSNSAVSWVFMKGNLARVVASLCGYYRQELGLMLHTSRLPDLNQLARLGEEQEVESLIRLVLGVAVTCPDRARHISIILSQSTQVMRSDDPVKMRTEILQQVATLQLESTFLHLRLAARGGEGQIAYKNEETISGETLTSDVGCQHEGLLETSFDITEISQSLSLPTQKKGHRGPQKDFQCQVNRDTEILTSDIIDVDDYIEKKDCGTDPVFEDKRTILVLEEKIRSLITALARSENESLDQAAENEKKLMELREDAEIAEKKLDSQLRSLEVRLTEAEDMRAQYEQLRIKDSTEIQSLLTLLETARAENSNLKEENREIEERLWNFEMMTKKQNFPRNIIMISNPETISTKSSGFISECSSPEKGSRLLDLQTETERLTELVGVMEMREEQLVGQVRCQEEARLEAERELELGTKMKKLLLLTAAFGAVHSALSHDLVSGSCTML